MSSAEQPGEPIMMTIIRLLGTTYGPYLFGVASLLLIWVLAIAPQLEAQRVDWQSQKEIVGQLHDLNRTQIAIGQTMEATARVLERTVEKLEAIRGRNGQ